MYHQNRNELSIPDSEPEPFWFGYDTDSNLLLTVGVSYTCYVPQDERFALNFGLQWLIKNDGAHRYLLTITPGFLTFGDGD